MGKFPPQLLKRVSGGGLKEKLRIAKEGGELEFSRIQSHLKARMVARDGRRKLRKSHDDPLRVYLVRAIGAPTPVVLRIFVAIRASFFSSAPSSTVRACSDEHHS